MQQVTSQRHFRVWHLLAVVAVATSSPALCATVTIDASKDATLYQNNVNNSSGGGNGLFVGTNGTGSARRGLISFDVADNVPAGATITDVQLTLFLGQVAGAGMGGGSGNAMIELHRVLADWGEGVTQKQNPSNDSFVGLGQGAAANAGDATWNSRVFSMALWNTPGGDFAANVSAATTIGTVLNAASTWGPTVGLVSDVQQWLAAPATNFGWELMNADETAATTFRAFYTRDAATAMFHPQLQITYTEGAISGDFNRDGKLTAVDVYSMIEALTDLHAYQSLHMLSDSMLLAIGDVDQNHSFNNADLEALLQRISSGGGSKAAAVPEPSAIALIAVSAMCGIHSFIRRIARALVTWRG